jgi:hypothetical protein
MRFCADTLPPKTETAVKTDLFHFIRAWPLVADATEHIFWQTFSWLLIANDSANVLTSVDVKPVVDTKKTDSQMTNRRNSPLFAMRGVPLLNQ